MNLRLLLPAGLLLAALAGPAFHARAAMITSSGNFTVNTAVPDNNIVGLGYTRTITSPINSISSVKVNLNITGGFNGDLYAYVKHGNQLAVLLNRVGRTAVSTYGYGHRGFNITLSDDALNGDVHTYRNVLNPGAGPLTGAWQPDARNVDPSLVLDTTSRTSPLSVFNGMDPSGDWTFFVADVSPLGQSTLVSFGLEISGVPEPGQWAMGGVVLLAAAGVWLRRRASRAAAPDQA